MIGIIGGTGFVGQNLCEYLREKDIPFQGIGRMRLDARCTNELISWIRTSRIKRVVNLAAECGGIGKNQIEPASLWLATTKISAAVLEACRECGVEKVVMVGTVCSYGAHTPVPFSETHLQWTGEPEETNRAYGMAKLSSLYGAQAYIQQYGMDIYNLIPVNMYGKYDDFSLESSHVIPAIIRKIADAEESGQRGIILWGDGTPTREFLHARDFAQAVWRCLVQDNENDGSFINIGTGQETSIAHLANIIKHAMRWSGHVAFDARRPNGQMRRRLDITRACEVLGFQPRISLTDGIAETVEWYLRQRRTHGETQCPAQNR